MLSGADIPLSDLRSDNQRLAHSEFQLEMDILHQYSHRPDHHSLHSTDDSRLPNRQPQAARYRRLGHSRDKQRGDSTGAQRRTAMGMDIIVG